MARNGALKPRQTKLSEKSCRKTLVGFQSCRFQITGNVPDTESLLIEMKWLHGSQQYTINPLHQPFAITHHVSQSLMAAALDI